MTIPLPNSCGMSSGQPSGNAIQSSQLFSSYPVNIEPTDLHEGMTMELRWTDATDKFGEYNLPVFGPPSARG